MIGSAALVTTEKRMAIVKTAEAEKVMKRCQIGTRNYNEANDLHAECYGMIGALVQERDMLRTGDTCARQCEGTAYRIEARQQKHRADVLAATIRELRYVVTHGAEPIGGASLLSAGLAGKEDTK